MKTKVLLHRVPGHADIVENEMADKMAKEAAQSLKFSTPFFPTVRRLKSEAKLYEGGFELLEGTLERNKRWPSPVKNSSQSHPENEIPKQFKANGSDFSQWRLRNRTYIKLFSL